MNDLKERLDSRLTERPGLTLFLLGFLTLFLELCLIRYMAGNIWNLGYFPNLVLLAVFVGMGTGFVGHRVLGPSRSLTVFARVPVLLLGLVILITVAHPALPGFERFEGTLAGELYFTAMPRAAPAVSTLIFVLWFSVPILIFAMISQLTAKVFARFAPLRAYTLDIGGSCCGILAFMSISWLRLPAATWFALLVPLFLFLPELLSLRRRLLAAGALAATALVVLLDDTQVLSRAHSFVLSGTEVQPVAVTWSPYQKVEFNPLAPERPAIHVNGIGHQSLFSAADLDSSFYRFPYEDRARRSELPPIRRVLVIGAGSGNDVACALRHGAEHVDAVEIDPVIAAIGRRHHPLSPYDDPRVTLTVDDGRAFLTGATGRYDLIVFALTDSLVKVSPLAQLRLENYIFTTAAIARAFGLLENHGTLVFYNYYREDWLLTKLRETVRVATGLVPRQIDAFENFTILSVDRDPMVGSGAPAAALTGADRIDVATDDWPFPYLRRRGLAPFYLYACGFLLLYVGVLFALARRGARASRQAREGAVPGRLAGAFALMGAAFLLLETKSIIQFSLLFGTTWLNNSLVLLAVLVLVLAANWTAHAVVGRWLLWLTVPALLCSSLATLVFPLADLLYVENGVLRFAAAALLTFSPVFFANLLFSVVFRGQRLAEQLFGWNLFGASLGGVLEYSSMALGYNALAIVVAALYALAVLLLGRRRPA